MKSRTSAVRLSLIIATLGSSALAAAVGKVSGAYDSGSYGSTSSASASASTVRPYGFISGTLSGTATGSAATPSSTRSYVHFDCGTHIGHGSDHFLDTIYGLHTGQFPNGTAINTTANSTSPLSGSTPFGGRYSPNSSNGIGKLRRALHAALGRQTNAGTAASASQSTAQSGVQPVNKITIQVYIHVVTTAAHAGMITPSQVTQQVAALNTAYNPQSILFTLAGSDFTTNDAWAVGGNDATDVAMKQALRKGTYSNLNLYFQSDLRSGDGSTVLGQCTLPTNVGPKPAPSVYVRDGCNIAAGTVPNGPINGYNLGKTAVHETGHWLGLLHTFEGYTCSGNGDFVADTPSESQSTDGCPVDPWKNTCSGRSGLDPIHNYMDYSTDACYTRFTPGQKDRMMTLWPQYRMGK